MFKFFSNRRNVLTIIVLLVFVSLLWVILFTGSPDPKNQFLHETGMKLIHFAVMDLKERSNLGLEELHKAAISNCRDSNSSAFWKNVQLSIPDEPQISTPKRAPSDRFIQEVATLLDMNEEDLKGKAKFLKIRTGKFLGRHVVFVPFVIDEIRQPESGNSFPVNTRPIFALFPFVDKKDDDLSDYAIYQSVNIKCRSISWPDLVAITKENELPAIYTILDTGMRYAVPVVQ